jgi:hypothetical protein
MEETMTSTLTFNIEFDAPHSQPAAITLPSTAPASELDQRIQGLVESIYHHPLISYSVNYAFVAHDLSSNNPIHNQFIDNTTLKVISIARLPLNRWIDLAIQSSDLLSLSPLSPLTKCRPSSATQTLISNWIIYGDHFQRILLQCIAETTEKNVTIGISPDNDQIYFYLKDFSDQLLACIGLSTYELINPTNELIEDPEIPQFLPVIYGQLSGFYEAKKMSRQVSPLAQTMWINYLMTLNLQTLKDHMLRLGKSISENPELAGNDALQAHAIYMLSLGSGLSDENEDPRKSRDAIINALNNCISYLNQHRKSQSPQMHTPQLPTFVWLPLQTKTE